MRPAEALAQQQMLHDALSKPGYRDYLTHFAADVAAKSSGPVLLDERGKPSGDTLAAQQRSVLKMAETFLVTAEMTRVVMHAAEGLDDLDRFTHDLWPAEHGFCWFEGGLDLIDTWGKHMPLHAITWERRSFKGSPGVFLCTYTLAGEGLDEKWASLPQQQQLQTLADIGRLQMTHTIFIADEMRVGPHKYLAEEAYAQYAEDGDVLTPSDNMLRILLALLMLLGQTIVATSRQDLRPANPKRARRMKMPGMVTTIALRRKVYPEREPGQTHVEWSHRWVVRGFWRSQPVGPGYPGAQQVGPQQWRVRLYIAPHIKGPADKPLVITDKVNVLAR